MRQSKLEYLKACDEANFGVFLRESKTGNSWAPSIHEAWSSYKRIAGLDDKRFHEDNHGLNKGYTHYWFKTDYKNLYLIEIRQGKERELSAMFFLFYAFEERKFLFKTHIGGSKWYVV